MVVKKGRASGKISDKRLVFDGYWYVFVAGIFPPALAAQFGGRNISATLRTTIRGGNSPAKKRCMKVLRATLITG